MEKFGSGIRYKHPGCATLVRKFYYFPTYPVICSSVPPPQAALRGPVVPGRVSLQVLLLREEVQTSGSRASARAHAPRHAEVHVRALRQEVQPALPHQAVSFVCSRICSCVSRIRIRKNHLSTRYLSDLFSTDPRSKLIPFWDSDWAFFKEGLE
jgi:hypothetical protein